MANIAINSTPTRVQYVATGGQTTFTYAFPIKEQTDLKVYLRSASSAADDDADILVITTDYTVSGANTASGGTVTLVSAADNGDIVTIVGDKPVDRTAIYDQSVTLTKADLNNDFNDNVMFDKQLQTEFSELGLKYNRSARITTTYREDNLRLPLLNDNEMWIGRGNAGDENDDITTVLVSSIDGITFNSTDFVIGTADDIYPDAQVLGSLANGLLKNTTVDGTGTVSIAAQGTDYYAPGGTDVAVVDGGTGASTAAGARTNLGLIIGTDVQAYSARLADISGLAVTDSNIIVGNGSSWVAESGATARASLGLTIGADVLAYDAEIQQIADLADPNADRILFWDDSAGTYTHLTAGAGLTITDTTLSAAEGDVVGPASSTDNALVRWDGTTGGLLQNSSVIIDDADVVSGITQLNVDNLRLDGNTIISTDTDGDINLTPDGTGVIAGTELTLTTDLSVEHGGTGVSSTTAYGVLAGGTTSTGAFQNIGTGTSGYVLRSNGAGALPTFQELSAPDTFPDDSFRVFGSVDGTKELAFEVDGITTGTTRTITVPDSDLDLTPTTGDFQGSDAGLTDIAGLAVTDGNIIVGNGTNWIAESGATARTSLGLVIGTDVQAYDAGLLDIAGLAVADGNIIVGDGANWVAESGTTARTSLGLTIGTDVQAQDQNLQDIADLTDPGADRILFWDDSAGAYTHLTAGSGLTITDTTITAAGGGGSGEATEIDIAQASHGFSVGDIIYYTGSAYAKAQADDAATAEAVGIVSAVADAGNFTLTLSGSITTLSGLTAGDVYFLSDATAGLLTATEPTTVGNIVKPMFVAVSTTAGYLINYRGSVVPSSGGVGGSGMTLVATVSESGISSVDFDDVIDATYDTYFLTISGLVPATDNTTAYVRVGTGSGPTYQTTNYNYGAYMVTDTGGTGTGGSSSTSQIHLQVTRGQGNAAGEGFGGVMYIFQAADTSLRTSVRFETVQDSADGNAQASWGFGFWNDTTAVTSIQVFMSSGNIASGEFRLYGLNN